MRQRRRESDELGARSSQCDARHMLKHAAVVGVVLVMGGCSPLPDGPVGGGTGGGSFSGVGGGSTAGGSGGGATGTGGGSAAAGGGTATGGGATGTGGGAAAVGGGTATGGGNAGAGGGGTTSSRSDELTAGTRLKVRAVVGVDGSRQQLGFFDSVRMENCGFVTATDGTQRCLPLESVAADLGYFSDAQCTMRLFGASCAAVPKYGVRYLNTTCQLSWDLHTLGAELSPTPTQVFAVSGANCVAVPPAAGYRLFPDTGAVSPSVFVQGNFVVEP